MTQKKTVLVTGGNGFIGTNLVRMLVASGEYYVVNLDALTYAANSLSLADLEGNPNYEFVKGNITDRRLVDSLFENHRPLGVFHLAAESHVDRSIVSADDFVQTNVVGTYTMLDAARMYWNTLPEELKKNFASCIFPPTKCSAPWGKRGISRKKRPTPLKTRIPLRRRRAIILCAPFTIPMDYQRSSRTAPTTMVPISFPRRSSP